MTEEGWGFGRGKENHKTGEWEGVEQKPFDSVLIGPRRASLLQGEHPHSRSDSKHYMLDGSGMPVGFAGHRRKVKVVVETNNYLKESGISGCEIRRSGTAWIYVDDVPVDEFSFRDPEEALIVARRKVQAQFGDGVMGGLWDDQELADLVGRLVYLDRTPAVITRVIADQGCVWVEPAVPGGFPPSEWAVEEAHEDGRDLGAAWKDTGYHDGQKVEMNSRALWKHRKAPAPLDAELVAKAKASGPSTTASGIRQHADRLWRELTDLVRRHGLKAKIGETVVERDAYLRFDEE